MKDENRPDTLPAVPEQVSDDYLIIELDDRMEFGVGLLETDLEAGDGPNAVGCGVNGLACTNGSGCDSWNAAGCGNAGCC
jgi:hypothetical protein